MPTPFSHIVNCQALHFRCPARWVRPALVASLGIAAITVPGDGLLAAESMNPRNEQLSGEESKGEASLVQLLSSWQACFTQEKVTKRNADTIAAACDHAATFSIVHPTERKRIAYRRAKVLQAADEARAPDPEKQ